MKGKHCRLYDELLVKNIILTAGLSVMDFMKKRKNADEEEICEFLELNADSIIEDTLEDMTDIDDGFSAPGDGWD